MTRLRLWRDGRFAWPPVLAVTFLCGWLVLFDFAWRMIEAQFLVLLGVGGLVALAGLALIALGARRGARPVGGAQWPGITPTRSRQRGRAGESPNAAEGR
ncbi:MAG: hypothetical protein FJ265_18130 [Planctomycetes bacterium]|nr:hypothetical protein [Planctomycetota bacterium]